MKTNNESTASGINPHFEWHRKPAGWSGAPCPVCGCEAKRLKALHRALKADELYTNGRGLVQYIKSVKVCFGTDTSQEAVR